MARTEVEIIRDGKIVSQDFSSGCVLTDSIGNLQVTTDKLADRSVTAQKLAASINFFPSGGIVMWNGSTSNIPSGWALCDGTNGTPDLRDRFIVGAGRNYSPNNIGGTDSVTLSENQMPPHSHSMASAGDHGHSGSTSGDGSHNHSGNTGGQSANHYHTANTSGAGAHAHALPRNSGWRNVNTMSERYALGTENDYSRDWTSEVGNHSHYVETGGVSVDHHHGVSLSGGGHSHSVSINGVGGHTHSISSAGSGGSHENRPPYYALCFIMKT